MKTECTVTFASYFGLNVEVICRLHEYSLIRFNGRCFIVSTVDLVFKRSLEIAA